MPSRSQNEGLFLFVLEALRQLLDHFPILISQYVFLCH